MLLPRIDVDLYLIPNKYLDPRQMQALISTDPKKLMQFQIVKQNQSQGSIKQINLSQSELSSKISPPKNIPQTTHKLFLNYSKMISFKGKKINTIQSLNRSRQSLRKQQKVFRIKLQFCQLQHDYYFLYHMCLIDARTLIRSGKIARNSRSSPHNFADIYNFIFCKQSLNRNGRSLAYCRRIALVVGVISAYIFRDKKSSIVKSFKHKKKAPFKALRNYQTLSNQGTLQEFLSKPKQNNNSSETTRPILKIRNNSLEEQLRRKAIVIKTLEQQNRIQAEKVVRIEQDYHSYKILTRRILIKTIRQISALKRKQNGTIKLHYGQFTNMFLTAFVDGPYLTDLRSQISLIQADIHCIKSNIALAPSLNQFQSLNNKLQSQQKKVEALKTQLKVRTEQVNAYKWRIKLSFSESSSMMQLEYWPLLNKRYIPQYLLGKGGFAEVYCCFDLDMLQEVAIKIHKLDNLNEKQYESYLKHLRRQISINKQLIHPNIAKMYEEIQLQESRIGIVMEYCSGPELRTYLRQKEYLEEKQAKSIIKQIISAVKYLHQQNQSVIHYDLKPANIVFHLGSIKIVDFGISKIMSKSESSIQLTSPNIGTCYYLPPQVFLKQQPKINNKVDIWSIGIIFYELLYGRKPFGEGIKPSKFVGKNIIKQALSFSFPLFHPKGSQISFQVKDFIRSCLQCNIDKRLTAEQAYNHPYFSQ